MVMNLKDVTCKCRLMMTKYL